VAGQQDQHYTRAERWAQRNLRDKTLRPRTAAYLIAGIWLVAIVAFGVIERIIDPDTFSSVWLAFWWALQTVTTVGYGDVVPGDTAGRALASVLMLVGLAFLSIVTATITSAFIAQRQAEMQEAGKDPVIRRLDEISLRLDKMDAEIGRLGGDAGPPDSARRD
jgi:voltage-gated potassium channel Kch